MAVTDKITLVEYIKRQLGSPVIKLEMDDTQIDDVIDDALDLFREYHTDALKLKWLTLDVTVDEQEYDLPDSTFAIVDVFGYNSQSLYGSDGEDQGYLMKRAFVGNSGLFSDEYSAVDIEVNRQRYEMYRAEVKRDYVFDYSYLEKKIKIMSTIQRNETLAIIAQCYLDDADKNYSSLWLRKYCVAMTGLLWAQNIGKYGNVTLPGGGSYNYDNIFSKYDALRIELEEAILDKYSDSFFIDMG